MTGTGTFDFTAPLWRHTGADAWHFVSLPAEVSEEIEDLTGGLRRGFGSVRVRASVGTTTWSTSVFPDSARGTYLLPVKKAVRLAEHLEEDDPVRIRLRLLDL